MANEAILRDTKVLSSRRFTCATGTAIPKGTLLGLTGDQTVSQATNSAVFAGIAHADVNNATDTQFNTETSVTADKGAVYELVASGSITRGNYVKCAGLNLVMAANATDVTSAARLIVGIALETASNAEVINVEVFP